MNQDLHRENMDLSPSDATSPFLDNHADQPATIGVMNYQISHPHQSKPSKSADEVKLIKHKVKMEGMLGDIHTPPNECGSKGWIQTEYNRLTDEIRFYEEALWGRLDRRLPSQDLKKLENYSFQSANQPNDNKSVFFQDHCGKDCEAVDRFSGSQMNQEKKIVSANEGVATNEYLTKNKENSLAEILHDGADITELLEKIHADVKSNVEFSDFGDLLVGERVAVGSYSFPLTLLPTVRRIHHAYGDISATSKVNDSVAEPVYILFCATIKEMIDLRLEQVTQKKILNWRDAIKDALRIGFHVAFAMEHLEKITCAYIGLVLRQELKCMAEMNSKLEASLNAKIVEQAKLSEEQAKLSEQFKFYSDFVEGFISKSLSTGLFT